MSNLTGLTNNEVLEIRKQSGRNILPMREEFSVVGLFFAQFNSPIAYILLAVAIISLALSQFVDAGLCFVILIVDVIMGFYQEFNAQRTLTALRRLLRPKTVVIRDDQRINIEVSEIVPGDVVVLASGDRIPADGRIISSHNLLINESILTGEGEAVNKTTEPSRQDVYMGTIVLGGKGLMQVEKIGVKTEMGRIGLSLEEIKEAKTPLELRIAKFTKNLVWMILFIVLIVFILGIFHHEDIWTMLKISVILAVASMPIALPMALTVILALGMKRILKRQGLVKKMLSIETLGSTSVICTDKTGTLTEGIMKVINIETKDMEKSLLAMSLVNEQKDSLEVALWNYVKDQGKSPQGFVDTCPKIDEELFDSEKKYAISINKVNSKPMAFMLGAPEIVKEFCDIKNDKNLILKIDQWASEGLRVLGFAYKEEGDVCENKDFIWLGLVGIRDPIRPEAKEMIQIAQKAGIKIKIVTGDYRKTAESVAKNLGFKLGIENIIDGNELDLMNDEELKEKIDKIVVFSRVNPHQKLKIIKVLQEKGEIVAMTGDGVNDAPALKKANIGIVVEDASDVAKEAADLILLDSNFKTIIAACEEGRLILSNIKKVIAYILSNAFAEIILITGALLLNFPVPLIVVQILWIQLICDGPPDMLLGFEQKDDTIMSQSPDEVKKEDILSLPMKLIILCVSFTIGLLALFFYWFVNQKTGDINIARTVAFAIISTTSLIYIFSFKNLKISLFQIKNIFANKLLFIGITYGLILVLAAIYVPFLNSLLKTVPLAWYYWLPVLFTSIAAIFVIELIKKLEQKQ